MTLEQLSEALAAARADARILDAGLWRDTVANVADGYAVQSLLAKRPGFKARGWKVTALTADQQRLFAATRPVAGAMLAPFVHAAPAALPLTGFVAPLLECEVAFLLGADLPPCDKPYTRAEIEATIEAVVPAMEVADCRLTSDASGLLKLADAMGNGAFISGTPVKDWRKLDLTDIAVVLSHDGTIIDNSSSSRILGNPFLAVVELANAQSPALPAGGLKRGQIVTTGTCTTPVALKTGRYVGDFGPLGTLQLDVGA